MQKCTKLVVPVAIALLAFGLAGKSMAETNLTGPAGDQVVVPVGVADDNANLANDQAIAAKDNLNNNTVTLDDVGNTTTVTRTDASVRTATITKTDASQTLVAKDNLNGNNVAVDDAIAIKDALNGNTLSDIGNDKSIRAEADDGSAATLTGNAVSGDADADGARSAAANNGGTATVNNSINISNLRIAVATSVVSGEVSNNNIAVGNGLEMEAEGNASGPAINASYQRNGNLGVNVAAGVNDAAGTNTAGPQANGPIAGTNTTAQTQAVTAGADARRFLAGNGSESENEALQANASLGFNSSEADADADSITAADQDNALNQTASTTTGDYTATQAQTVYLATGDNILSGTMTANGINSIAMNSGINALFQQSVNVQATVIPASAP